ncbi:septum formation initiator family protein [Haloferula sargassicola]|uniref:Septum formation initiator n=1 Tax=Haloferula sargassicola TaxID=490096 RepID=A0ABP9UQC5_9BACT
MNSVILCVLGTSLGALTVASALPQYRKLAEKHEELERVLEAEKKVVAEKEDSQAALDAMREDPEYLELHAIDRLNLHRPGTTIYRIERER